MSDKSQSNKNELSSFPIVGLCASASGLKAYEAFFKAMPSDIGMAFVVVQHLVSHSESILHNLLQHHTTIPVQSIENKTVIKINHVYVLPGGYEVRVQNQQLYLSPFESHAGWPKIIDNFLMSLSDDQGELTAAVIFSGAGTDGLEGVRVVKENGGLVIAQDLESAAHDGMPSSVIHAGLADTILHPKLMPDALGKHFERIPTQVPQLESSDENLPVEAIHRVLRRVRRQTEHDFTDYKLSTLQKQITRRMSFQQVETIDAYLDYMHHHPQEVGELGKSFLIHVTEFFRDPDAFEVLKQDALMPALKAHDIDTIFRVWVPGCATGEEAVSIAILIYECLQELDMLEVEVRLFATDINREVIQHASDGIYPLSVVDNMDTSQLQEHFIQENDAYHVRPHIMRMIVWAQHNLIDNPPFSNLHLISCRNVLIYFQKQLQERVIAMFQFALRPEGILFLGSSETAPTDTNAFTPINRKHKIYQRLSGPRGAWLYLDRPLFIKVADSLELSNMTENNPPQRDTHDYEQDVINRMIVEHYNSTCAIVDARYQVQYTSGEIDRYLHVVPGRHGQHNILDMAREGMDVELTNALHQAFEQNKTVVRRGVGVKTIGEERIINLIVKSIQDTRVQGQQKLIIFEHVSSEDQRHNTELDISEDDKGMTIKRLREELHQSRKALQVKSEEFNASEDKARATHEELLTSQEELQSMNEELNALNTQLVDQNEELTDANNILHNFLQSTEIGVIFLDLDLAVREFTAKITNIFSLRDSDKGRPLFEITNQLKDVDLIADGEHVLDILNLIEKEVQTTNNRWYNMRIHPYRTTQNIVNGLVLTFSDITGQKQAQNLAEQQTHYIRQVIDTVEDSLLELDGNLRVVGANQSFYQTFQVNQQNTIGQQVYDLGNGQWDIPELRRLLTEILPEQSVIRDYKVKHDFPDLGIRNMRLNARQIAELDRILLVITEISIDSEQGST